MTSEDAAPPSAVPVAVAEAEAAPSTPVPSSSAANKTNSTDCNNTVRKDEEEDGSLHNDDLLLLETPTKSPKESKDDSNDQRLQQLLIESLGLTVTGTCQRHTNCPVVVGSDLFDSNNNTSPTGDGCRITSCRICYAEEKRVGLAQQQSGASFCDVVQHLHQQHNTNDNNESNSKSNNTSNNASLVFHNSLNLTDATAGLLLDEQNDADDEHQQEPGSSLLHFLQSDRNALQSVLKRLTQVQNWQLRQKELLWVQEKMKTQRLQQQVEQLQQQSAQQRTTIQSLRRSIQQDLKVIQTFAKQQQLQEEFEMEQLEFLEQEKQKSPNRSPNKSTLPSPQARPTVQAVSSFIDSIPEVDHDDTTTNNDEEDYVDEVDKVIEATDNNSALENAGPESIHSTSTSTAPTTRPTMNAGSLHNSSHSHSRPASFYWSGVDESEVQRTHRGSSLLSSRNIFQSFRGGLLDIPKSPPRARHDAEDPKVGPTRKNKLQLNSNALNELQLPERALSRSNSAAVPQNSNQEIPLAGLVEKLAQQASAANDTKAAMPAAPALLALDKDNKNDVKDHETAVTETYSILTMASAATASTIKPAAATRTTAKQAKEESNASNDNNNTDKTSTEPESKTTDSTAATEDETAAPTASNNGKFVFSVTGASCHDKFGDEGTYTGTILVTEGLPHGHGQMDYEQSGRQYVGEWVAGQWHGKGKLLNPNGDSYEGEFYLDARHGQGVYKWDNGDVYTGQFQQDKRHGQGQFHFHNGNAYKGEFFDGMFQGYGRYDFLGGFYEGEWKEGRYDGSGELQYANGGKYTGEFRHSVAHGFGMEVLPDGTKRRGVWVDGQPSKVSVVGGGGSGNK